MYHGRVVGHATATVKHPSLGGAKLLLVMATRGDGRTPEGSPVLAVDTLGAGHGERVMIASGGIEPRKDASDRTSPVRWRVLGIPDR